MPVNWIRFFAIGPFIWSIGASHYTQVNTIAMEMMAFLESEAGLGRDKAGNLTGRLHSQANSHARKYFFDKLTWDQREAAIRHTAKMAVAMGVTTIHAMEGGDLSSDEDIPVFLEIMDSLPLHVVLHWCSTAVPEVMAKGLKIIGTDILLDGSIGSRTAAFREPYADDPEAVGELYYSDKWITNYIETAHRGGTANGFSCHRPTGHHPSFRLSGTGPESLSGYRSSVSDRTFWLSRKTGISDGRRIWVR